MDETGTEGATTGLRPDHSVRDERLRLVASIVPKADFVSQLIAEREHLPPQRARRRATPGAAVDAYQKGGNITVRRLPAGYRRTVVT